MKCQLKVIKADGSVEEYLHTKVLGTVSNAIACTDRPDVYIAEELTEAVTYFLYHKQGRHRVATSEIFSIIKATLAATGYEEAAVVLSERRWERKLKRCRIEVVSGDIGQLSDAQLAGEAERLGQRSRWDKSRIAADLVSKHGIARQTARTIASMVEEKILGMGLGLVPASLIKQLVLNDTAAVLRAQRQLQTV